MTAPVPVVDRHGIGHRLVALTFDDGPSEWTPLVLDLLERHQARATFFVLGSQIAGREDTLRRIVDTGSELGNHTFSHPDLATLSAAEVLEEIEQTTALIKEVTHVEVEFWRAPFAVCFGPGEKVEQVVASTGLVEGRASVVPWDFTWPAEETAAFVLERVQPGSIVDLHDGRPANDPPDASAPTREATVRALASVLETLTADGYRCVTLGELVGAAAEAP